MRKEYNSQMDNCQEAKGDLIIALMSFQEAGSDPPSGRIPFSSDQLWNLTAGLIILSVAILSAAQWPAYPYFLDSYYHLTVIEGMRQAGGPVLHAFWESAPEGRPHLYPPLFHLLWLPAIRHLPPLFLARFWS